ncbi:glycosyl hydrolase [Hymenobacter sp. UYP22]|uniref:glycosyl hydrolase n=1 Tax=Hymenobacter sp. UYP22 TaxID=3156348 RepID=UPI00339B9A6B
MHYSRWVLPLVAWLLAAAAQAQTPFTSLNYLYSVSGRQTVAGEHNREPNTAPAVQTKRVYAATGKYPGLWSGDFLFAQSDVSSRWTMINEAKAQWARGALINLMWHTCPPTQPEPCQWSGGVQSTLSDAQWQELVTDGTPLNNNWKARLDGIAGYLQDLEDSGVEVMFRPFHEMNQAAFWWGGRPGPFGTAKLYQLTHDYLKNIKGLTNLIWVWDVQDFSTLPADLLSYNPGNAYWDVLALDMYYSDGQGYTMAKYNALLNAAGSKPIAIGECEVLPSATVLAAQPRWSFFMGWAELVFNSNSAASMQSLFTASNVVTRDEMPGWGGTSVNLAYRRPVTVSTAENSTHAGSLAVDDDRSTRWSSAYADNQFITVDLGAAYNLSRVYLAWEAAYAQSYQVQVSADNATWTTMRTVQGKSSAAPDNLTNLNTTARYVRLNCLTRATSYGFSLLELEVYGAPAGPLAVATRREQMAVGFPNPTSNSVYINLPETWSTIGQLTIQDSQGRTVALYHLNRRTTQVNVSFLAEGVYHLLLTNGQQQVRQLLLKK